MIVLDTNVLSELMRHVPDPHVLAWVGTRSRKELHITSVTQAEILYGIHVLPLGKRRTLLKEAALAMFREEFAGHILPFDQLAASCYAELTAARRLAGRPIEPFDALIAATALTVGATVATRNLDDFTGCGLTLIDPWTAREKP